MKKILSFSLIFSLLSFSCRREDTVTVNGEMMVWHTVTLEIRGPVTSEMGDPNPFLDYRLSARFTHDGTTFDVPGFYAADGDAAGSGSTEGNTWLVRFSPDAPGTWSYTVSFREGPGLAVSGDTSAGKPLQADSTGGTFEIVPSDKKGDDFRARGRLSLTDGHYLRFSGNGEYFLKGGADSPENFLGYRDFDGTLYGGNRENRKGESAPNLGLHAYEAHKGDWHPGDPSWMDGKGKGIIGGLNYLASKGVNSMYFLTLNILGDGDDVWPYNRRDERYRFDCSKLDQWEKVFSHMDSLGIMMHVVLQETENECLLDAGYLDVQRKLYLRELVARFAHHPALVWNLGEEHGPQNWTPYGQTVNDTKKMASFLRQADPYNHPIVIHTHSSDPARSELISPYLGFPDMDGPSIQVGNPADTHAQTLKWLRLSSDSGHNWIVCLDETGPAGKGVLPDDVDPGHDTIRNDILWGNLMAGGGGVEWYFGYQYHDNDLNCENWRSRDHLWDQTKYALDFFKNYLPFNEMKNADELTGQGYCFAKQGEIYVLYLPSGGNGTIDLSNSTGQYTISWFDPRHGGELQKGSIEKVNGGRTVSTGYAPADRESDWVCLMRRIW